MVKLLQGFSHEVLRFNRSPKGECSALQMLFTSKVSRHLVYKFTTRLKPIIKLKGLQFILTTFVYTNIFSSLSQIDFILGRFSGSMFQQSSMSCLIFGLHSWGIVGVKPWSRIFPPIVKGSSLRCGSCWQIISQQTIPNDHTSVFSLYTGLWSDSGAYMLMAWIKFWLWIQMNIIPSNE